LSFVGAAVALLPRQQPEIAPNSVGRQVGSLPYGIGTPSRKNDENFSNHFLGNNLPQTAKTIL
jgi:hypothetical protein